MVILSSFSSFIQMIFVLIIFVFVLVLTAVCTKWIGKFQQGNITNKNIKIIETFRVTNNKFIQIVQVGTKYIVIAVCKDSVTKLAELTEEEILELPNPDETLVGGFNINFEEVLNNVKKNVQSHIKKK